MLNLIIRSALANRLIIVGAAAFIIVYGWLTLNTLPVDVFPDLTKPTVTVMTEGHGRAPEEVEALITLPLEYALNGLPQLERIRSTSGIGLSVIYLEFSWDADIYKSRQLVAERLQLVREQLPNDANPFMAPIASLMGQIQQISISTTNPSIDPMQLRTLADWTIRPRLLAVPGVAQVIAIGGGVKQYQILLSSQKVNRFQISMKDLNHTLESISHNTTGGFIDKGREELLVRNIGAVSSIADIEKTVVGLHFGKPVLLKDIATIQEGPKIKRGDGSYMGRPAVVIAIQKQPDADTLRVTQQIESAIQEIQPSLPKDISINTNIFKQSRFIETATKSLMGKLQYGSLFVLLVLLIFLANLRMSLITLIAIPLSFSATFIVFKFFGLSVNTMTLGGLAIAIGELVDDSIVDIENIFRRLRENAQQTTPLNPLTVIYQASSEVRNSIFLATIIIILVFLPLLNLTGLEGRLLLPLAIAYMTALGASLVVSLTLTPVLASIFLTPKLIKKNHSETLLVRSLKKVDRLILGFSLKHPLFIGLSTLATLLFAVSLIPKMGKDLLPKFNEGTAMVALFAKPGISLAESSRLGKLAEEKILSIPEVSSVSRRTGRAENDEHTMGVNVSEIDIDFKKGAIRKREEVLNDIRTQLSEIPGVSINVGQPLSHLIDHTLSGVSSQIAIKLFGNDLAVLRWKAAEIREALKDIPGIVDLRVEQQALIGQLKIHILRENAARLGLVSGEITELLEAAFNGHTVGQILKDQRSFDLFYRFDNNSRQSIKNMAETVITTLPNGHRVKVKEIADIYETQGPNEISRENTQRRIVVSANVSGRDLDGLVTDIERFISNSIDMPEGYFYFIGGQHQAQKQAFEKILIFGFLSLLGIAIILFSQFRSILIVSQVMLTIPFSFIGGIFLLYMTTGVISVASLVGFITLCGIASRNGIMMISHYLHLLSEEGESFGKQMIIRGSLERLVPVLMTALVTSLALLPIALSPGQPGSEILYPVAIVIVGGLISSTLLDTLVTPTLFYNYCERAAAKSIHYSSPAQGGPK